MNLDTADVSAINLGRKQALLTTGHIIAIDILLDEFGDETDDPSEALAFVTSEIPGGGYLRGSVSDFFFTTLN